MAEERYEERFQMVFDSEFINITRELWKEKDEEIISIGHGATVIVNHQLTGIIAVSDREILISQSAVSKLPDLHHPLIDSKTKKVIGVFFPKQNYLRLYKKDPLRKLAKLELGRYFAFTLMGQMLHNLVQLHHQYPLPAILIQN